MKEFIRIRGWRGTPFAKGENTEVFVARSWFSPDNNKAVFHVYRLEDKPTEGLYVAVNIFRKENGEAIYTYVAHQPSEKGKWAIGVEWRYLKHGFCVLKSISDQNGEVCAKRLRYEKHVYTDKYTNENGILRLRRNVDGATFPKDIG